MGLLWDYCGRWVTAYIVKSGTLSQVNLARQTSRSNRRHFETRNCTQRVQTSAEDCFFFEMLNRDTLENKSSPLKTVGIIVLNLD